VGYRVVNSALIADGTVETVDLTDCAVTSAKIANGAVAEAKIASGAVTGAKIADGAILPAHICGDQAFTFPQTVEVMGGLDVSAETHIQTDLVVTYDFSTGAGYFDYGLLAPFGGSEIETDGSIRWCTYDARLQVYCGGCWKSLQFEAGC